MIDSGFAGAPSVRHSATAGQDHDARSYIFRRPVAEDATAVFALVAASPPLDPNSLYCNLLQCTHFANTCVIAERDGQIDGWISAYRPPSDPRAIFVWQVAVHERARGQGLGSALLAALHKLPSAADAERLITTVTPSNQASRQMFAAFARRNGAELTISPLFDRERHLGGTHDSEELISIGPLLSPSARS